MATMKQLIISIGVIFILSCVTGQTTISTTISPTTSENSNETAICHFYGDPHVIVFPQQSGAFQNQYWCRISGEHYILQNEYVQIVGNIQNGTWLMNKFIVTLFEDNKILCTITDNEQYCNSPEIRITRPSLTQIEILYTIPRIYISIIPHHYQQQWYDISVRMPYAIVHRSNGLCVMPLVDICQIENSIEQENNINPLSRSICELYLMTSDQATIELGLVNDLERRNNALIACIHDYETTGNKNFGASIVNMIIKHGINKQQLEDLQFQFQTISSIDIINNAVNNANILIDTLLSTTTSIPATSITTTVPATSAPSTTTSDCSIIVKPIHNVLIVLFLSLLINLCI